MLKRCVCGMHYRRNELFTKISVNHTAKFSCDFSRYGVISPPKFKLFFALLLWIVAHFYTPIFNLYNSTLPIHNLVSIFQMHCGLFTCNIHMQCSMYMCLYSVKSDMLATQSNILVFHIPNQYSYFAFKFLRLRHSCLSMQCWYLVCMLWGRVRYRCYTIQYSSLDIELHAWVTWPWDRKPLYKIWGLKIIACGVPVVPRWHSDADV